MHILMCFAKGFGLVIGVVGGLVLLVHLLSKLARWIAARTGRGKEDIGVALGLGVVFLAVGTLISLGFCGIIK